MRWKTPRKSCSCWCWGGPRGGGDTSWHGTRRRLSRPGRESFRTKRSIRGVHLTGGAAAPEVAAAASLDVAAVAAAGVGGGVAPACPSSSAGGSGVDRSLPVEGTLAFLPVCARRSQSAPVGVTASFTRGTPFFPRSSVQTMAAAAPPRGATSRRPRTTSDMATPTGWWDRGAVVLGDDRRRIAPAEAVYDREKAPPAGPWVGVPLAVAPRGA